MLAFAAARRIRLASSRTPASRLLPGRSVGVAGDDGKRVVEVVREPGGEPADRSRRAPGPASSSIPRGRHVANPPSSNPSVENRNEPTMMKLSHPGFVRAALRPSALFFPAACGSVPPSLQRPADRESTQVGNRGGVGAQESKEGVVAVVDAGGLLVQQHVRRRQARDEPSVLAPGLFEDSDQASGGRELRFAGTVRDLVEKEEIPDQSSRGAAGRAGESLPDDAEEPLLSTGFTR